MNRGRISISVVLSLLMLMFLIVSGCSSSDDALLPAISGTVTGDVKSGVAIYLSGASISSTTTDADGNYSFRGRANGTYTVIPVLAGYTFSPVSAAFTVSGANVTGKNFTATANTAPTYSISGTVTVGGSALPNVIITILSSAATGTAATDASGNYNFNGLVGGGYTVTPSLAGYTFTPDSRAVVVSGANATSNFVATALPTYTISGTVSGDVKSGVAIYLSGASISSTTTSADGKYSFTGLVKRVANYLFGPATIPTTTTDADGNYSIAGLANGNYTVIPVLNNYTFIPVSTAFTVSGANVTENFTEIYNPAVSYSISGKVTGAVQAGVTITLSGGAATGTYTTLADGSYIFSNLVAGDYTVTPSKTLPTPGYTFNPIRLPLTITTANLTDKDFAATVVFSQADLGGTWKLNVLKSGGGWFRATVDIAESGALTMSGCMDDGGDDGCPTDASETSLTWIIDENGVISADIILGGEPYPNDAHYTMTLNKNFIAGTMTSDGNEYSVLQKVVPPVTAYSATDIHKKAIVAHILAVGSDGSDYTWMCLTGIIKSDGKIYMASMGSPLGYATADPAVLIGGPLILDTDTGVVTDGSSEDFKGFLSDDKKTIVATTTDTNYQLVIIQITGDCADNGNPTSPWPFTPGPIPAGTYSNHSLGIQGTGASDFWVHSLFTVDNMGKIFFDPTVTNYWVSSNPLVTAPTRDDYISIISPSGTVKTSLNDSYHGQMSGDGMFIVGTRTSPYWDSNSGDYLYFYSLGIDIRTNGIATTEAAIGSVKK